VSSPVLLLIEDDVDHVDVITRALRKAGVTADVRVVRDGQEAIDALGLDGSQGASSALPRVVFLDLKMPRVDGWEVLQRLRSSPRTARVPVVVVSGSDRREDIERSYALGANSYLLKRFDPRGPGAYLAEAARYWIEMNRVPGESELLSW
jgi:two-component system response regulator